MDKGDAPMHIRVSSAIMFKNYIKRNWRVVGVSSGGECWETSGSSEIPHGKNGHAYHKSMARRKTDCGISNVY